ncbi:hypothetical protein Pelo_16120 [Pelomyxa schiedti]|nr:hypothetical protein Pelo_16120 [Pelomyxa schiedti]
MEAFCGGHPEREAQIVAVDRVLHLYDVIMESASATCSAVSVLWPPRFAVLYGCIGSGKSFILRSILEVKGKAHVEVPCALLRDMPNRSILSLLREEIESQIEWPDTFDVSSQPVQSEAQSPVEVEEHSEPKNIPRPKKPVLVIFDDAEHLSKEQYEWLQLLPCNPTDLVAWCDCYDALVFPLFIFNCAQYPPHTQYFSAVCSGYRSIHRPLLVYFPPYSEEQIAAIISPLITSETLQKTCVATNLPMSHDINSIRFTAQHTLQGVDIQSTAPPQRTPQSSVHLVQHSPKVFWTVDSTFVQLPRLTRQVLLVSYILSHVVNSTTQTQAAEFYVDELVDKYCELFQPTDLTAVLSHIKQLMALRAIKCPNVSRLSPLCFMKSRTRMVCCVPEKEALRVAKSLSYNLHDLMPLAPQF